MIRSAVKEIIALCGVLLGFAAPLALLVWLVSLTSCGGSPTTPPETITSYPGAPAPIPTPREGT